VLFVINVQSDINVIYLINSLINIPYITSTAQLILLDLQNVFISYSRWKKIVGKVLTIPKYVATNGISSYKKIWVRCFYGYFHLKSNLIHFRGFKIYNLMICQRMLWYSSQTCIFLFPNRVLPTWIVNVVLIGISHYHHVRLQNVIQNIWKIVRISQYFQQICIRIRRKTQCS